MYRITLQLNKDESITIDKKFSTYRNAMWELNSYEKTIGYNKKMNPIKRIFYNGLQVVGYHVWEEK